MTDEELAALLGTGATGSERPSTKPGKRRPRSGTKPEFKPGTKPGFKPDVDTNFKYRILFMLVLSLASWVRILFLTIDAARNYEATDPATAALLSYALHRLVFTFLLFTLYSYSYLRDWHFKPVAVLAFCLNAVVTALDYYKGYSTAVGAPLGMFILLIVLRFASLYCLLMNALNAHRAPPMPRRPWS